MITKEFRKRIVAGMAEARERFSGSDTQFAKSLSIDKSQYNRVKGGDIDKVISAGKWISIARKLGVNPKATAEWNVANTPVYQFLTAQLEMCQQHSMSGMLCDLSDIGKTFTAEHYAKTHNNVAYIDCSQVKTKRRFIRKIAQEFGVGTNGKHDDIYEDLVFYLKTLPTPLIILDEAGDLQYDAFLEIKALMNATAGVCGVYMMGADGLKRKMQRAIQNEKVGYAELFSRFGKRYGKAIPEGDDGKKVLKSSAMMIIKANAGADTNVNKVLMSTMGEDGVPSLRRINKELIKGR